MPGITSTASSLGVTKTCSPSCAMGVPAVAMTESPTVGTRKRKSALLATTGSVTRSSFCFSAAAGARGPSPNRHRRPVKSRKPRKRTGGVDGHVGGRALPVLAALDEQGAVLQVVRVAEAAAPPPFAGRPGGRCR